MYGMPRFSHLARRNVGSDIFVMAATSPSFKYFSVNMDTSCYLFSLAVFQLSSYIKNNKEY